MKYYARILYLITFRVVFLLVPLVNECTAQAEQPAKNKLEAAQENYGQGMMRIEISSLEEKKEAQGIFRRRLDSLRAQAQQSGNLELLQWYNRTIEGFEKKPDLRPEIQPNAPSALRSLQSGYRKRLDEIQSVKNQHVIRFSDQYIHFLQGLQVELTKHGRIEEAVQTRDEISRIQKDPAIEEAFSHVVQEETNPQVATTTAPIEKGALEKWVAVRKNMIAVKLESIKRPSKDANKAAKRAEQEWRKVRQLFTSYLMTPSQSDSTAVKAARETCRAAEQLYHDLVAQRADKSTPQIGRARIAKQRSTWQQTLDDLEVAAGYPPYPAEKGFAK